MEKTEKRYCNNCKNETNQTILFNEFVIKPSEIIKRNESGDEMQPMWFIAGEKWTVSKCNGCNELNFKVSVMQGPGQENIVNEFLFPSKTIRKMPGWIFRLPIKYLELFSEVYNAINNESYRLALMGSRTIIDIFIVEKIGDTGTYKQKMESMVKNGYITEKVNNILSTAIDAGNAAIHRGFKPDKDTIDKIMDIIENIIQTEILDRDAKVIKKVTPSRK